MSKAFIDDTNLTNIANAIRTKLGVSDTYLPSEMAGAIQNIPKRKVIDFNITPKTLDNAEQNSLQYVKAYGKCEQNGTPTPTSPVDIVCNNGVVKARHQSGLPLGYTLLDYIESSGIQYIDTGFVPNQDTRVELDGQYTTGYGIIFGVRTDVTTDVYTIQKLANGNWVMGYNTDISIILSGDNNRHVWLKDKNKQYIDNVLIHTATYANFTAMGDAYLFRFNNNGTPEAVINGTTRVYSCKIWDGDTLIRDMVPAKRNSDNVLGMYDTVSGQFFTNAGSGTFVAGNTVSDPTIIYTEGNTETIRISSENLVDFTSLTIIPNTAISETGELVSNNGVNFCESYISVLPNQTYKISGDILGENISQGTYYFRLASYNVDKIFISRSDAVTGTEYTFTTDSTTKYIRFHYINTATLNTYKLQLDNTATCERLLSLNGYTDTQEIISGIVNRKIGIKVLDGSEVWSVQTGSHPYVYHNFYDGIITDPNYILNEKITHFECVPITVTTNNQGIIVATRVNRYTAVFLRYDNLFDPTTTSGINTLKTFLQTQYNNGTPVIIVYPLATPTTETVTAQSMQTVEGDNILEITQAALSGLEVECEYFLQ